MLKILADSKILFIRKSDYYEAIQKDPLGFPLPSWELFELSVLAFDSSHNLLRIVGISFEEARNIVDSKIDLTPIALSGIGCEQVKRKSDEYSNKS